MNWWPLQGFRKNQKSFPILKFPKSISFPEQEIQKLKYRFWMGIFILFFLGGFQFLQTKSQFEALEKPIEVVVAKEDLLGPKILDSDDLVLRPIPARYLPKSFFKEKSSLKGQLLEKDLFKGSIITPFDLGPLPQAHSLSVQFETSKAIIIDESWLLSPLPPLSKGDHLDIWASNPKGNFSETKIIAQALKVLQISEGKLGKKWIAVEADENSIQNLIFSRSHRIPLQVLIHPASQ